MFRLHFCQFIDVLIEFDLLVWLLTQSLLSWASLAPTSKCTGESVLYVTETLELDGDILDDSGDGLSSLSQEGENEGTIHLAKDPSCAARYFITHDYGVHAVAVPLLTKLSQLAAKNDGKSSPNPPVDLYFLLPLMWAGPSFVPPSFPPPSFPPPSTGWKWRNPTRVGCSGRRRSHLHHFRLFAARAAIYRSWGQLGGARHDARDRGRCLASISNLNLILKQFACLNS